MSTVGDFIKSAARGGKSRTKIRSGKSRDKENVHPTAPHLVGGGGGASGRGRGSQSGVGSSRRQPLPPNKTPTLKRRPYIPPGKKQAGGEVSAAAEGALNISY